MIIHHYEQYYRFYLSSEDRPDISRDDAEKGLMLPAGSTHLAPPLENCKKGMVPVFRDGTWEIVKDDFWRPSHVEINYNSGRPISSYEPKDYSLFEFPSYPSLPQLCNTTLVVMRIVQNIRYINKKFDECIQLHRLSMTTPELSIVEHPTPGVLVKTPSALYECKLDIESIIFQMRRVLDSLVQLTNLLVNFRDFEKTKKLKFDSIGSVLHKKAKNTTVAKIICGGDGYEADTSQFLTISNDLFNGYKHSLMNDESFNLIGSDYLTIVGYSVKYSDHNNIIQHHNHYAHQIMMGFQDCVARILNNQKLYIQPTSA